MKNKWLLCSVLILVVESFTFALGENNPYGIICTYHYKEALSKQDVEMTGEKSDPPLYLLEAIAGKDSTILKEQNSIEELLDKTVKQKKMLLYVHGDHGEFSRLLKMSNELMSFYDVDFLLFTWPSNEIENNSIKNYKVSKKNAYLHTARFLDVIEIVSRYAKKNDVELTVMFHSIGNLFAKNLARMLLDSSNCRVLSIDNIILNAPCVWEYDHDIWVDVLARHIQKKVYITKNANDIALKAASFFIEGGNLLGQTSVQIPSQKACYLDFTEILNKNKASRYESHSYFISDVARRDVLIYEIYRTIMRSGSLNVLDSNALIMSKIKIF